MYGYFLKASAFLWGKKSAWVAHVKMSDSRLRSLRGWCLLSCCPQVLVCCVVLCSVPFCSVLFRYVLFCSVLFFLQFCSVLLCTIPFLSVLLHSFSSVPFHSVCSVPLRSVIFCYVPFHSVTLSSVPLCSVPFRSVPLCSMSLVAHPSLLSFSQYGRRSACFWLQQQVYRNAGGFNPLNVELNPICHLLALLGAHHILHVSRVRVKRCCLTSLQPYDSTILNCVSYVNVTAARDREFCLTKSKRSAPAIVMPAGLVPVFWVRCSDVSKQPVPFIFKCFKFTHFELWEMETSFRNVGNLSPNDASSHYPEHLNPPLHRCLFCLLVYFSIL
jgi:hypothetical protein